MFLVQLWSSHSFCARHSYFDRDWKYILYLHMRWLHTMVFCQSTGGFISQNSRWYTTLAVNHSESNAVTTTISHFLNVSIWLCFSDLSTIGICFSYCRVSDISLSFTLLASLFLHLLVLLVQVSRQRIYSVDSTHRPSNRMESIHTARIIINDNKNMERKHVLCANDNEYA